MANSNDAKRAAFMQRIKVNQSSQQQAAAKGHKYPAIIPAIAATKARRRNVNVL